MEEKEQARGEGEKRSQDLTCIRDEGKWDDRTDENAGKS